MTMIKTIERATGPAHQVYGYRKGRKIYVGTFDTRPLAIEAEEDFRVTTRKIRAGTLAPETDTTRTYGTAADLWFTVLSDAGSRSHDDYKHRHDRYLVPSFGPVRLVDITKASIIRWRDELAERVHNNTVNTVMGTLSSAFAFFVDRQWLAVNPCHGVKRLKSDPRVFPWLQSTEAITRLLSELPWKWRSLAAFLVGTGCRLDEACRCTWDDVDLEHRIVTLRLTKANKVRRVPVFDSVLAVLKEMKLRRGTEPLLWPGGRPGKSLSPPSVRKPFKRAAERAGMPKELRIHDLRHTFASLFLADGGDIFKLSRILGHHSVAITERTYAHLKPTAYAEDYGRVRFWMPQQGRVIALGGGEG